MAKNSLSKDDLEGLDRALAPYFATLNRSVKETKGGTQLSIVPSDELRSMPGEIAKSVGEAMAGNTKELKKTIQESLRVTVPAPIVTVPEVKVPNITVPEIKIPEIHIPPITVPEPRVTVNVDSVKITNLDDIPKPESFDDSRIVESLKRLENKTGGASGPTEYISGGAYSASTGVFGVASMWEDASRVMRTISATTPLPVGSGKTIKSSKFSLSVTGTAIAAVANKRIKVFAVKLVVSADISVKWRNGASTDLEDSQPYVTSGGYTESVTPPSFLFGTTAGQSLDLVITGTGTASGRISYFDDDAT